LLSALLEEERKAYRNQVEESAKQIQVLQGRGTAGLLEIVTVCFQ
jgi:hypothetical protein